MKHIRIIFAVIGLLASVASYACTSAIIIGKDGKPMLWKHRDTGTLDNRLEHFKGEKYSFVGLVNSSSEGGEVWIGSNTAGFSIMNTASYCLKDDNVPAELMDKEGILMYRALEICASLADFEHFLDTLSRPMGVEANFGCIDSSGGAAYYETSNDRYVKRDVAAMPEKYCVVTNFSVSGRPEDWKGVERQMTASDIFRSMEDEDGRIDAGPYDLMNRLSRSYAHKYMGIDLVRDSEAFLSSGTGYFPDQDFIPRRSSSASVAVKGNIMWAALGYPSCAVMIPVPVSEEDHVPACMNRTSESMNCEICDISLNIKYTYVFTPPGEHVSNMDRYVNLRPVLAGTDGRKSLLECCRDAEEDISEIFMRIYSRYGKGSLEWEDFLKEYDRTASEFIHIVKKKFKTYHK